MSNDQQNLISITFEHYIKWLTKEIIRQCEVLNMCYGNGNWVVEKRQCYKALQSGSKNRSFQQTIKFVLHAFLFLISLDGVIRRQKNVVAPRVILRKNFWGVRKPCPQPPKLVKYDTIQNLSCRVSLERKFNSKHISHKNQGPKVNRFLKQMLLKCSQLVQHLVLFL